MGRSRSAEALGLFGALAFSVCGCGHGLKKVEIDPLADPPAASYAGVAKKRIANVTGLIDSDCGVLFEKVREMPSDPNTGVEHVTFVNVDDDFDSCAEPFVSATNCGLAIHGSNYPHFADQLDAYLSCAGWDSGFENIHAEGVGNGDAALEMTDYTGERIDIACHELATAGQMSGLAGEAWHFTGTSHEFHACAERELPSICSLGVSSREDGLIDIILNCDDPDAGPAYAGGH